MDRDSAQVFCPRPGRREKLVWLQTGHAYDEMDGN